MFGADHIYRMDPQQMVDQHIASGAAVTVAGIRQPLSMADQFGVIEVGRRRPADPRVPGEAHATSTGLPDAPDEIFASMGNYVFTTAALRRGGHPGRAGPGQQARHGRQHHPDAGRARRGNVYDFRDNDVPGSTDRDRGYWRDVGTLDSFYEAHMDLIASTPVFNLYNFEWPIFTEQRPWPPAKFVHGCDDRQGRAVGSMISPGVVVSGSLVNSVVSPNVRVNSWATVGTSRMAMAVFCSSAVIRVMWAILRCRRGFLMPAGS